MYSGRKDDGLVHRRLRLSRTYNRGRELGEGGRKGGRESEAAEKMGRNCLTAATELNCDRKSRSGMREGDATALGFYGPNLGPWVILIHDVERRKGI